MNRAAVIGSGPNGLTAAILLAKAGFETTVYEAQSTYGGGVRSAELTLPGFVHDVGSAVHPLGVSSPVWASMPLAGFGLRWIYPDAQVAHPFADGGAAIVERSVSTTAAQFGPDEFMYRQMFAKLATQWQELAGEVLSPLLHLPRHPLVLGHFGVLAWLPASLAAQTLFRTEEARAVFAGMAAHSVLPLEALATTGFAMVLSLTAHAAGWPLPQYGAQSIAKALVGYLEALGGRVVTSAPVASLDQFDDGTMVMCDVTPRQFLKLAGDRLPSNYRRQLESYRYGPGVFKLDWALSEPVPWLAKECARAATVHVGGSFAEIAASERAAFRGEVCERPFILFVQPTVSDPSRAPAGKHIGWAYCHVPNGCAVDMTERMEAQIERFAPGFRSTILARSVLSPAALEQGNANLVGGDISGGVQDWRQLLIRPTRSRYRTPLSNVYLCSSSTPPGGGVHGMCGYHAVRAALKDRGTPVAGWGWR
jgi:phytoene dehydrogenase-like protein